jgi:hypothetical protein
MAYVTTTSEFHNTHLTRMRLCWLGNPDVGVVSAGSEMISGFPDTGRHRDVCRMTCLTRSWRYKSRCCSTNSSEKKTRFPRARVSETKPFQAIQSIPTIQWAVCTPRSGEIAPVRRSGATRTRSRTSRHRMCSCLSNF